MIKTPHYQQQRDHHEQQHQEGPLLQRHVSRREPLLRDDASNLWYTQEETDLFKAWLSHQVHKVRSHLEESSALLDEELITVDAAAILGLEKYLSCELTAEYKNRRLLLQRAVLEEHRWQSAVQIPHPARLALISAKHSRWARERARAAALFLDQDVMQDLEVEEFSCQPPRPRCGSTSVLHEDEGHSSRHNPTNEDGALALPPQLKDTAHQSESLGFGT
jgi:hypothetical protein